MCVGGCGKREDVCGEGVCDDGGWEMVGEWWGGRGGERGGGVGGGGGEEEVSRRRR